MSNGSTADLGGLYAPFANTVALDAMPFKTPDGNIAHGTDSTNNAPPAKSTYGIGTAVNDILDTFFGKGPIVETPKAATERKAKEPAGGMQISTVLVWSVVLVIAGLLMLSRGFGVLTEEGENIFVNVSDPKKYPGIGHAIQGAKKSTKAAAIAAAE